jgi:hypothetical protein
MIKSNLMLGIGAAFALMITAAPAFAQMGDNHGQMHNDGQQGGGMGHDDHGGDKAMNMHKPARHYAGHRSLHHPQCKTVWRHHHRVKRCW